MMMKMGEKIHELSCGGEKCGMIKLSKSLTIDFVCVLKFYERGIKI
jgi:hypothetical protein